MVNSNDEFFNSVVGINNEVEAAPTDGAGQENESGVVGGGFDPTRYVEGPLGDVLSGPLYAYEKLLEAGQGALGIIDDIVQGFETGEYLSGIPQSLAGQNILLQGAKAKAEYKRDTYENYVVDMVRKGASEKLIKEQDPTNTVKMEKLTDWFEKTLPAPAVDSETGETLDYISLYGKGEIIKGTDALISDIAGSFPSLLISRVPIVGPAILGASTYMGEFESELIKRAKDPSFNLEEDRDNLVQNALITGASDFVWETVGGSMLNKIPGMKLGKEKVVDIIKESPKQLMKKAGLGFLSEFTTEGATGVTTELADVLSFGDDVKPIKDYFRTFFKDGFIGGFLGAGSSGASGLSAQNKEVIHEYVSPQTYKQDQFKLSTEIFTLEQDKQKAKGKDAEYFETKIQELKDKKKANKENLNNFFNSLTKEQKVEYASNIDKQNDAINIIGNKDYSKEAQEMANKDLAKYTEANNKFFKDTEVNYIADFEDYAKRTISNAAKLRKARGVFGFDNKNLNLVELNTAEEIKEVNDRLPGFNEADGLFLGEDASGKPTMYINKKVAAETGATNVLGHEYLHAITSMAFKESGIGNENLGKAAKAFTEYLKSTGNSQVVEDIEERLAENYGGLDADGNIVRDENGLVKTNKKEQQEEYFNLFSDLISKEKIKNVEEKSGGIKNAFRQLFVGLGFSKVDFKDGKQVFDFLVDYNANMERAGILGKFVSKRIAKTKMKGLEATAAEKAAMDLIKKESKSGYTKTERDNRLDAIGEKSTKAEWDAGGSGQAISDMYMSGDLEAIVRNNLSSDLKNLPNYSEEDFISETIGELMPHIRNFNPLRKEDKNGKKNPVYEYLIKAGVKESDISSLSLGQAKKRLSDYASKETTSEADKININKTIEKYGLSGWIRGQVSNKIGEVLKKKKATTETFTVDTTDEKVKETVESDDDLQDLQEEDLSVAAQAKKKAEVKRREEKGMEEDVEYSTFRRALKVKGKQGLSDNIVDNVKQAVVKTMATERTTPDSDEFIANIKKSFLTELKKPIQDMMGKKDDFTNFLKTNREAIIAALPTSTLVQMERNVDPADRVFTVEVKRNLNPTETKDAIANNLLPKDTNINSGPTLYNKRMPSEGEFLRYFNPPLYVPSKKDPNKFVRSGLKGTRKDTLAEQMGIELAFDATMEVVQSPDVAERRSLVTNTDFLDSGIEELARSIGRGVDIKFSKSKFKITRNGLVATGLGIQYGIIFDPKTKTYKLAPEVVDYIRKNTPKGKRPYYPSSEVLGYFKDFYNDLPTSTQLDLSLQGEAIGTEMGRLSKLLPFSATKGHLFEAVIARYGYNTLKSVQPGITIISKYQAAKKLGTTPSKLPDIVLWDGKDNWESADSLFTVEAKFDNSRAGGVTITDYKFKDFTPNNTKVLNKYDSLDETGEVISKTWKQDMLEQFSEPLANFVKEAEALGTKIVDSKTKVPIGVHNALRKKGNSFLGKVMATGEVKADQVVNYYNNGKFKPVKSDVIAHTSKGAFTLGVDPHGLYANGILPKLAGDYQVTMRLKTNVSKDKTFVTYTPILEIEFRSSDIRGEYADGRKVDASDLKLQNKKDFEKVLKNVKGFKLSKSQSTSKAMELGQLTNKDTEAVGMSTFDFDDTLAFTKSGIRLTMPNPSGKPQPKRKAILLAGNAGAGKTTIIKQLGLRKQGFKYVNQDIALDWLTKNNGLPQDMNDFTRDQSDKWRSLQGEAAVTAKNKASKLRGQGDGVVIDGTGAVGVQFQGMAREFKDAGYDVQIVFVESSLETALERNKNRSERRLTDATVRNSIESAKKNKKAFKEMVTFFPYSAKGFVEINTDNLKEGEALPTEFVKEMDDFTKGYIKDRINAEDFALRGADLLAQGAEYDFSEFNKVVDGTPGPLLDKAKERAKKFGNENMFILTARPAESAGPIREFLKSQGLDIPLENITGLGNSTSEAKAQWMLDKFAEGYNDMYFVDDALPNVEAVKNVLDQLDVKGKSVQATVRFSKSIASTLSKNKSYNKFKDSLAESVLYHGGLNSLKNKNAVWFIVDDVNGAELYADIRSVEDEVYSIKASQLKNSIIIPDINDSFGFNKVIKQKFPDQYETLVNNDDAVTIDKVLKQDNAAEIISEYISWADSKFELFEGVYGPEKGLYDNAGKIAKTLPVIVLNTDVSSKARQVKPSTKFSKNSLRKNKAVQNVLDQLDIKSNVQQAKIKFSKTASQKLNDMIERKKGIDSDEIISSAAAKRRGANVNKFQVFVPPTAEDFSGLLYYFAGKGKQGDADLAFMKEFLLDPLSRGERDIAIKKQSLIRGYNELKDKNWKAAAKIKEMAADTPYTKGTAVRVYLWNQDKTDIPGLSDKEVQQLVDIVKNDPELIAYADGLRALVGDSEGKYITPSNDWVVETIAKDLQDATSRVGRKKFLAEFIENADAFFSKDNLNKMEAAYGKDFRESLEDMLYRIKTGQNRPSGTDASTKKWMNWLNNSVGAIMFFNTKSAVLQLMSTVNYLNWSDNNFLLAGKAFANQKQFWSDFSMLWNSDFLKQRRFGLSTDINEAEIANAAAGAKNKATAVLAYLLKKGFLPTQIADSFAISSGGAAFYRNRVNSYIKQGMDQKAAEEKAMTDFREITEENQQSSRPDRISKQQASPLGRVILAFQNTPMQYARIIKKSVADIVAGRGDLKTHVSKIIFYGGVQSLIFGAMQNALFALAFDDEEDDKNLTKTELEEKQKKRDTQYERTLNTMLDSLLNGSGLTGRVISTIKNTIFKFMDEKEKGWNSDMGNVAIEAANISPPLGSKLRKMKKAGDVYDWNQKVIDEMDTFDINNPIWEAGANVIESTTNVPAARAIKKLESIREAFNQDNETWQRIAVIMGWSQWDLGIEGQKRQAVQATKEYLKKKKKDEKAASKKPTTKKSSSEDAYFNKVVNSRKNEASKVQGGKYRCTALTQDLSQCKNRTDNSSRKCFLHN